MDTDTNADKAELTFADLAKLQDPVRFYQQKIGSDALLFDQHSSNYFILEENAARLIDAASLQEFMQVRASIPPEEWDTENGFLTRILELEDEAPENPLSRHKVSHLKLNLSNACNLNCRYCFREKEIQKVKDPDIIYKAIDYMVYESGKDATSFSVGVNLAGEPFLDTDLLMKIADYVMKINLKENKSIGLYFITNGTLLSSKELALLKKFKNDFLHVSLDGPREVHDKVRLFRDGRGSYDLILKNIKLLKKKKIRIIAESCLTPEFPYPAEVVRHLAELGVASINLKPVRSGQELAFDERTIEDLIRGYAEYFELLTTELLEKRFYLLRLLKKDFALKFLYCLLFRQKLIAACFWGIHHYSMDEKGDYYTCEGVLGRPEYKIGSVETGIDWEKFHSIPLVSRRVPCRTCWARNICGGTCYVNSINNGRDYTDVDPVECRLNLALIQYNLRMLYDLEKAGCNLAIVAAVLRQP